MHYGFREIDVCRYQGSVDKGITHGINPMKKPLNEKKITRKKMCSKKKENLYIVQESENPNCTAKE